MSLVCSIYVPFTSDSQAVCTRPFRAQGTGPLTVRSLTVTHEREPPIMYSQGDAHELRQKFWHALADAPHVMLQLDSDPDSAAPMTTQLDRDANHAIWFFLTRDNHFAGGGPATATFASKDHETFARFHGTLVEETSRDRLEKQWSSVDQSWFPGGKDDPNLLMLRMDLGDASIWCRVTGMLARAKMAVGADMTGGTKGQFAETRL